MKHRAIFLFVLLLTFALALTTCGGDEAADSNTALVVVTANGEASYTRADLEALQQATVEAEGSNYVGVPLAALLQDAGVDPAQVSTVSAVASDGFSAEYDAVMVNSADTIVAYATEGGDLADDEQPFRMVLPGQQGRLNVRMLARIEAGS